MDVSKEVVIKTDIKDEKLIRSLVGNALEYGGKLMIEIGKCVKDEKCSTIKK